MKLEGESYMHSAARQTVVHWLREAAAENGGAHGRAYFGDVYWAHNRRAPLWGVWPEYPFVSEACQGQEVWDECSRFGGSWGDLQPGDPPRPPTFEECCAMGRPPLFIADIALQHKGCITYAIEVVHKHPVSSAKRRFYRMIDVKIIEVSAKWVLGQTSPPKGFPKGAAR